MTTQPTPRAQSGSTRQEGAAYARSARADHTVGNLYGRIVPRRVRRYLRRAVSPGTRSNVRHRLGRLVTTASRATSGINASPTAAKRRGNGEIVVRWRRRPALATVVPDATPLSARRRNLDLVCRSLEAADVPYFVVRNPKAIRSRVAVLATHRDACARALEQTARRTATYLQLIEHESQIRPATTRTIDRAVAERSFRVIQLQIDPTGCLLLGPGYGCEIEFWDRDGDLLTAPRKNPCTDFVPADQPATAVKESVLTPFSSPHHGEDPAYPSRPAFAEPIYSDITFPIDVVYTWVDGEDPEWQLRRAAAAGTAYHPQSANSARFISHDELRYSLRSVRMNMPWVRHIFLVTDRQVPRWLDRDVPGLTVLEHRDIFFDPNVLPTFNSHSIETQLHHIPGLSEHFVYLNDDVCIGAPVTPGHFFLANGSSKFFPSPALIPPGPPTDNDIPSSAAAKNNRELIRRAFGTTITHKMKHVPHALRKDVLAEIEDKFAEEHRRTAASRFRDSTDISVTSSLHHYYAFHTGRAVPGSILYSYLDLAAPSTPKRLRTLLVRRDRQVLCLNDTTVDSGDGEPQRSLLIPFLEAYYPVPSPHELPGR